MAGGPEIALQRAKTEFDELKQKYLPIKEKAENRFKEDESDGLTGNQKFEDWILMNYPELTAVRSQLQAASARVLAMGQMALGPKAEEQLQDYRVLSPNTPGREGMKGVQL